jgi:thiol-disulfide isomerase/thioredoxin
MVYSTNFAGKVVILNFWATWCLDCRLEIPELVALQEKYRADGLVVVGANTGGFGDTPAAVQYFLQTFAPAINYQVVMASLTMMQDYGVLNTIPITFVIDRQNLIRKKFSGPQTADTLEKQIIPWLYDSSVLASRLNGSQLLLSWPTQAQAFTLEATTNLAGTNWTAWPTPPTVLDGTNTVSVTAEGSPRYFRLHLSY